MFKTYCSHFKERKKQEEERKKAEEEERLRAEAEARIDPATGRERVEVDDPEAWKKYLMVSWRLPMD